MPHQKTGQPALDPFAFPAETNVRFLLLIVAAVILAVAIAPLLEMIYLDRAVELAGVELPPVGTESEVYFREAQAAFFAAVDDAGRLLYFPTLLAAAVLVLAQLIYRRHPARLRRRNGLQPIAGDSALHRTVEELSAYAKLPPPSVEAPPGLVTTGNAQAFGLRHHYAIRFDDARVCLRKQPAVFRAVFLHELAHIANGDISRTYFAEALWRAVYILAVAAYILGISGLITGGLVRRLGQGTGADWGVFFRLAAPNYLLVLFQLILLLALVYAIRASILRTREIYADWRSGQWGAAATLLSLLSRAADAEQQGGGWRRGWRLHPTARTRLAALQNPHHLFRLSPDLPFFVGALLALVADGLLINLAVPSILVISNATLGLAATVATAAISAHPIVLTASFLILGAAVPLVALFFFLAFLLVGYLVAGTVGVQLLREEAAARSDRPTSWLRYVQLWLPAALLVIGLEVGFTILPQAALSPLALLQSGQTGMLSLQLLALLAWLFAVLVTTWLWLVYARFLAGRLAAKHGSRPPRWKQRLFVWASSALVTLLYLPFFLYRLFLLYQIHVLPAWAWLLLPFLLLLPLFFVVTFAALAVWMPLRL